VEFYTFRKRGGCPGVRDGVVGEGFREGFSGGLGGVAQVKAFADATDVKAVVKDGDTRSLTARSMGHGFRPKLYLVTRVVAAGPIAPLRRLRRGLSAKAGHELRDGATGVCAMMLLMSVAHDEANGKRYHL
jgi:hypothetical protein